MVAKVFCILLYAVLCESKKSLLPQAILQLVQSNYGERPGVIEVFYNLREVKFLDETLKMLSSEKQLKVTPINTFDFKQFDRKHCPRDENERCIEPVLNHAIFLFDTLDNYVKFKRKLLFSNRFRGELNHLVYCEDGSEENIQDIITPSTYESFLLVKNDRVSLHTMTMYTEKQCKAKQLVEINQFSSLERKWTKEKFFMPRIENFHGCELRIELNALREAGLPFERILEDETVTPEGSIVDMVNALSTPLNFTAHFSADKKSHGHFLLHDFRIGADKLRTFWDAISSSSSDPIFFTSDIFVVPPGELYTSWEKLFMPFDQSTWMWLGITFAVAFLCHSFH